MMAYSIIKGETILTISTALLLLLLFSSFAAMFPANAQVMSVVDRAEDWFMYPSLKEILSNQPANITEEEMSIEEWRAFTEQSMKSLSNLAKVLGNSPQMASINDYNITGLDRNKIHVRVYDPGVVEKPSPILVYAYGGGFVLGSVDVFDDSIRRLANSSGLIVAAMDYRLAPEHPFPAALNDVLATVRWIGEHAGELGADPDRIGLGGHSSGASLALATAMILRDSDIASDKNLIDTLFLVAGGYSPEAVNSESMRMFGQNQSKFGATIEPERILNLTFQNASDYNNPLAFPLLAENLTGLPPVYIAAMALDPLKDDSIQLSDRLREEGQEYYLTIWPGVTHPAIAFIPIIPEIQEYLDAMTVYLRGVLLPTTNSY
jgi:acetyl esterase